MNWYHGGVPGLRRGDKILPPAQTNAVSIADTAGDMITEVRRVYSREVVYLAASPHDARLFASLHPAYGGRNRGGDLYLVEPDGPVTADPDYLAGDGGSVTCASATIIRVIQRRVPRPSVTGPLPATGKPAYTRPRHTR